MRCIFLGCITALVLLWTAQGIRITPSSNLQNKVFEGDTSPLRLEWKVEGDPGDQGQGRLLFSHNDVIFGVYDIERKYINMSLNSNPNRRFTTSARGQYGIKITQLSPLDGGAYGCTAVMNDGEEHKAINIDLFVYATPTTPIIIPQTPILKGHDVTFSCHSQSRSSPIALKPSIQFTWFRDDTRLPGDLTKKYSIDGATLVVKDLDGTDQGAIYRCEVREEGSRLIATSETFDVMLITIQKITGDLNKDVGDDISIIWGIHGQSSTQAPYNNSLVFSRSGHVIARYHLNHRIWESELGNRIKWYSPVRGSYGFRLYSVMSADIGFYACAYTDQFETEVMSPKVRISLKGHTFPISPAPATSKMTVTRNSLDDSTKDPELLPGSDVTAAAQASGTTVIEHLPLILGSSIGGAIGSVVIIVVIVVAILFCRKRQGNKKPKMESILREKRQCSTCSSTGNTGLFFTDDGSRYSIYNTLRESLMIRDDVMPSGPMLPPRDDTYNQPFEDMRVTLHRATSRDHQENLRNIEEEVNQKQRQLLGDGDEYLTPAGATGQPPRRYNVYENKPTKKTNNDNATCKTSLAPEIEENGYLMPTSLKKLKELDPKELEGLNCSQACSHAPLTRAEVTAIVAGNSRLEKLEGGVSGNNPRDKLMGDDNHDNQYIAMSEHEASCSYMPMSGVQVAGKNHTTETKDAGYADDIEYINISKVGVSSVQSVD